MFESDLGVAEGGIGRFVAALDADCLAVDAAESLLGRVERLGRLLEGVKLRLAARVADTPRWRDAGHRSPAHWLAAATGSSIRHADDLLDTAAWKTRTGSAPTTTCSRPSTGGASSPVSASAASSPHPHPTHHERRRARQAEPAGAADRDVQLSDLAFSNL